MHLIKLDQRSIWRPVIRQQSERSFIRTATREINRAHNLLSLRSEVCALVSVSYSLAERNGAGGWWLRSGQYNPAGPKPRYQGNSEHFQTDTAFTASRVNQVGRAYDPKTDRNIALENARMAFHSIRSSRWFKQGQERRLGGLHVRRRERLWQ